MFFHEDELVYLPKDHVIEIELNQSIEPPVNTVLPSQIVHNLIDEAEVHWIMDFCICRESAQCQDYPADLGCLFMGETAGKINSNLGRLVLREEAHKHIEKSAEAGLVHLIGRNKLDTIWLSVGPGEKLLTVCNCCPCCCLWKMLPELSPVVGEKISRMEGVELTISDNCIGCGTCTDSCFVNAIQIVDEKAQINEECRGCGRCVEACPEKAIKITAPNLDDINNTILQIKNAVDVK
jgi:ferredoxin